MLLKIIIFITGAAILSLELLASRIMTPYFGVSLYIWSGILVITLVSLAIGYWLGGILAQGTSKNRPDVTKLTFLFAIRMGRRCDYATLIAPAWLPNKIGCLYGSVVANV